MVSVLKKKRFLYNFFGLLSAGALVFGLHTTTTYAEPDLEAEASILVDMESGKILYQDDVDVILPIASMSKMMTEYLVNEAVKNGELSWEEEVSVSEHVAALSQDTGLSNVFLTTEDTYTVEELYESMAIYSANGATIALAEAVSGSEGAFVELMNEKAGELGLEDYQFVNSTGLNNSSMDGYHPEGTEADAENLMSARSTALLAYHLINDYPEILETASIEEKVFREGTLDLLMENWNWMLPGGQHEYEGVDGLKTGFTSMAGNAFTGTVEQGETRLISVVMRTETRDDRFLETAKLFDYGFDTFTRTNVLSEGSQVEGYEMLPVPNGKEQEVGIEVGEDISLPVLEGEEEFFVEDVSLDGTILDENGDLNAPLEAGETVGYLTLDYEGEGNHEFLAVELEESARAPIVLTEDVEKANWFSLSMRGIGDFFSGLWGRTTDTVGGWFS